MVWEVLLHILWLSFVQVSQTFSWKNSFEDAKNTLEEYFESMGTSLYKKGIQKIDSRWENSGKKWLLNYLILWF